TAGRDLGRAPPAHRAVLRVRREGRAQGKSTTRGCGRVRGIPRRPKRHDPQRGRSARLSGPARRHGHDGALAADPDGSMLVRIAAEVQAVLPPVRPGYLDLTDDHARAAALLSSGMTLAAVGRL